MVNVLVQSSMHNEHVWFPLLSIFFYQNNHMRPYFFYVVLMASAYSHLKSSNQALSLPLEMPGSFLINDEKTTSCLREFFTSLVVCTFLKLNRIIWHVSFLF